VSCPAAIRARVDTHGPLGARACKA